MSFSFGTSVPTSTPSLGSIGFGQPSGGFSLSVPSNTGLPGTALGTAGNTLGTGLTFGTPTNAVKPTGLSLPTTNAASGGLTFGGGLGGTTSTGLTLGSNTGGLSLGGLKPAGGLGGAPATGGLTLGGGGLTLGSTPATGGLTLGSMPATGGLTFGSTPATGGLTLGGTTATGGLKLGSTPATGGLTLGSAPTAGGLTFGSTPSTGGLTLGGTGGLTLGGTTTASGLTLGGTATSGGLSFGGGGLTLGGAKSTAFTSGTTTTLNAGLTLGGLGSTTSAASVFSAGTPSLARGLGGADPSTSTATSSNASSTDGKSTDSKNIKETPLPNELSQAVENFRKFEKEQKSIREEIAHMPSKPIFKVQEEVAILRQLLSLVSNSLQRNAVAIDNLKAESLQELKNSEISQRTKDTPPGLQYENTAPTEYFHTMVEDFVLRMHIYRQQIEELESSIAALNQLGFFSPQELSTCFSKIHETFVALAAQLYAVHEAVKVQKEHFLNYRQAIHGDTSNIFEKRRATSEKTGKKSVMTSVGPTPFSAMSNAAALAMAAALNRTQQAPAPGGPPTLGLGAATGTLGTTGFGSTLGTGLGTGLGGFGTSTFGAKTTQSSIFGGTGGLGSTSTFGTGSGLGSTLGGNTTFGGFGTNTATVKPLGGTLFGSGTSTGLNLNASVPSFGSTAGNLSAPLVGSNTPQFGFGTATQPFQLQNPPTGNKRGKR